MIPPPSWSVPGQEAGDVDERQHREVERVAGPDEPRRLLRRVDVERAGQDHRLVADDAYGVPVEPGKADDKVLRPPLLHLEELPVVHDHPDGRPYVVGLARRVGDERR